jgi:hypothetical protein
MDVNIWSRYHPSMVLWSLNLWTRYDYANSFKWLIMMSDGGWRSFLWILKAPDVLFSRRLVSDTTLTTGKIFWNLACGRVTHISPHGFKIVMLKCNIIKNAPLCLFNWQWFPFRIICRIGTVSFHFSIFRILIITVYCLMLNDFWSLLVANYRVVYVLFLM